MKNYPGEPWPWLSLPVALVIDTGLLFTPLVDGPASRRGIIVFALPDIIICLVARLASYPVTDEDRRAVRQQMILGLVVASLLCAILFGLRLVYPGR